MLLALRYAGAGGEAYVSGSDDCYVHGSGFPPVISLRTPSTLWRHQRDGLASSAWGLRDSVGQEQGKEPELENARLPGDQPQDRTSH